jgi:hypothetical protein
MKTALQIILLLVLTTSLVNAQSTESGKKTLYLHSLLGVHVPSVGDVNAALEPGGYLSFNRLYFSRGAGFYTIFPKVKLASMFTFSSFSGSRDQGSQSNWLRGTSAGTALGITLINGDNWQVIPYGGIVYSWFGLRVANNAPANINFPGYFAGPSNQHHVSSEQFMGHFGLHLAKVRWGNSALGQKLLLGIRAGYYLPIGSTVWKTNDVVLPGGPGSAAGGTYVQFMLGLLQ